VSGERRLRAAKLLDWTSIDAKVIQTVSEGESAAKGLIENLQREDLNPIEEAEGFKELQGLNDDHWTQEQIAKVTGKGRTYITDSLRLLNLPEDVQEDVRRQTLSRSHAIELLRLNNAKEQKRLAAKVGKRGLTVMQTRAIIDRRQGKLPSPQSPLPSGHGSRTRDEGPADPLSDLWPALHERQGFAPGVDWEARYGAHKPAPGIPLTGWYFFAGSFQGLTKAELSSWFRQMAQALETGQEGPALSEAEQQAFADKVEAQELGGHFKPLDPAEITANPATGEAAPAGISFYALLSPLKIPSKAACCFTRSRKKRAATPCTLAGSSGNHSRTRNGSRSRC